MNTTMWKEEVLTSGADEQVADTAITKGQTTEKTIDVAVTQVDYPALTPQVIEGILKEPAVEARLSELMEDIGDYHEKIKSYPPQAITAYGDNKESSKKYWGSKVVYSSTVAARSYTKLVQAVLTSHLEEYPDKYGENSKQNINLLSWHVVEPSMKVDMEALHSALKKKIESSLPAFSQTNDDQGVFDLIFSKISMSITPDFSLAA